MSLINQMLQDLDKRSASSTERGALPNQVRALPREGNAGRPGWLLGIVVALGVIAVLGWQLGKQLIPPPLPLVQGVPAVQLPTAVPPSMQIPPAVAVATSVTATKGPASRLALELATVPLMDNPTAATAAEPPAQPKRSNSRAKSPQTLSGTASSASAKNSPRPPPTADSVIGTESAISLITSAATPSPVRPVATRLATTAISNPGENGVEPKVRAALANPQIDKRLQQLTPSQLAENDYRDAANLLSQGRLGEAQEGFQRALRTYPEHIGARQGLFGLLVEAKKNAEAEQVLRDGLKLNPNQPGFALALSGLQYQRGDTPGAIETLQRTAPAAQGSPDYLARLAALLQRQSRHQEAVDYYQAALRLAPGSGVWLMGLGISQQALSRTNEAQDAFRRAKASNTLNPDLQAFVDQRMKQLQ